MSLEPSPYIAARAAHTLGAAGYRPDEMRAAATTFTSHMRQAGHDPRSLAQAIKAGRATAQANPGNKSSLYHQGSVFTRLLYVNNHRNFSRAPTAFYQAFLETRRPRIADRTRQDIKRRGQLHWRQDLDATIDYLREADQEPETNADRYLLDAYAQAIRIVAELDTEPMARTTSTSPDARTLSNHT